MKARKKLVVAAAGLLLMGLGLVAGGTSTAKPVTAEMPTTSTTGY